MREREESILSDFVKRGWTLTDNECPVCGSPLLKKNEKFFCGICNKEIKIAESMDEYLSYLEENMKNELREKIIRTIELLLKDRDVLDEESIKSLEKYVKLLKDLKDL